MKPIDSSSGWRVEDNGVRLQFYADTNEILGALPGAIEICRPASPPILVARHGARLAPVDAGAPILSAPDLPAEIWFSTIHERDACEEWLPKATTELLNINGFACLSFCFEVSTGVTDSASLACVRIVSRAVTFETRDYSEQILFIRRLDRALGSLLGRIPLFSSESSVRAIPRFWISSAMASKVLARSVKIPYWMKQERLPASTR